MKKISKILIFILFFSLFWGNFAFFNKINIIAKAKEEQLTTAKAMAVMETSTGRLLYAKNQDEKLPMASTTKIITAIVAIENNLDLDRQILIEKDVTGIEGTSIYLKPGEQLSIKELLYGLMLRSGNDAALAIAKATTGSVDTFIDLANNFCERVGAKNTRLTNPHGLHDNNHYTTAYDLALISSYAMQNPEFAEIVSTKQKIIDNEHNLSKKRILNNKNKLLKNMDYATGIKTGFTSKAGRCFVGSAKKDDMEIVCVLLNCNSMFEECQVLLEKGFTEYKMVQAVMPNEIIGEAQVEGASKKSVKLTSKIGARVPLKVSEVDKIKIDYDYPKVLKAPIDTSTSIGKFDIYTDKDLIFSGKIYIIENVESKGENFEFDIIKDFVHLDRK